MERKETKDFDCTFSYALHVMRYASICAPRLNLFYLYDLYDFDIW